MKFFHMMVALAVTMLATLVATPATAAEKAPDCRDCELYRGAKLRKPHPTSKPLVCVNFTLPSPGAKVTLRVTTGYRMVIEDSKEISTREGQFCYPRDRWLREGGVPDKVYLCSQHSVTLNGTQIAPILSGRGESAKAFACLRGIAGCGGRDNVSLPTEKLGN